MDHRLALYEATGPRHFLHSLLCKYATDDVFTHQIAQEHLDPGAWRGASNWELDLSVSYRVEWQPQLHDTRAIALKAILPP